MSTPRPRRITELAPGTPFVVGDLGAGPKRRPPVRGRLLEVREDLVVVEVHNVAVRSNGAAPRRREEWSRRMMVTPDDRA